MRLVAILVMSFALASCKLPADWAEEFVEQLECDMSLAQVQSLTSRDVYAEDAPRQNMTHSIRDGSTDVWLVFENNKLKSAQVLWAHKMMKYAISTMHILPMKCLYRREMYQYFGFKFLIFQCYR